MRYRERKKRLAPREARRALLFLWCVRERKERGAPALRGLLRRESRHVRAAHPHRHPRPAARPAHTHTSDSAPPTVTHTVDRLNPLSPAADCVASPSTLRQAGPHQKHTGAQPPRARRMLAPLYGGGFAVAVAQVAAIYYGVSAAIHWGIPAVLDVKSIQVSAGRREREGREREREGIGASALPGVGRRRPSPRVLFWSPAARARSLQTLSAPAYHPPIARPPGPGTVAGAGDPGMLVGHR